MWPLTVLCKQVLALKSVDKSPIFAILRRRDDFTHVIHDTVSILYCNTQQLPQGVITQSSSRELLQPLGLEEGDAHSQTFFFFVIGL